MKVLHLFIVGVIVAFLFGGLSAAAYLTPQEKVVYLNKPEDEGKINALVVQKMRNEIRWFDENKPWEDGRYLSYRNDVLYEHFAQVTPLPRAAGSGTAILGSIAFGGLILALYSGLIYLLDFCNVPLYFKARAEYLKEKLKAERKILDDLIKLQEKISEDKY